MWCGVVCGAWCVVHGAWCVVRGAWCVVRRMWCVMCGVWCVGCGVWGVGVGVDVGVGVGVERGRRGGEVGRWGGGGGGWWKGRDGVVVVVVRTDDLTPCVSPYESRHKGGRTPGSQTPDVPATLALNVQVDGVRKCCISAARKPFTSTSDRRSEAPRAESPLLTLKNGATRPNGTVD